MSERAVVKVEAASTDVNTPQPAFSPRELWYDPKQIAIKMILVVKQSSL